MKTSRGGQLFITERALRERGGEVLRRVESGEAFVLTRRGIAIGHLTPVRRSRFVSSDALKSLFENAPEVDFGRFRSDLDEFVGE